MSGATTNTRLADAGTQDRVTRAMTAGRRHLTVHALEYTGDTALRRPSDEMPQPDRTRK